MNSLSKKLFSGRMITTAEFLPPAGSDQAGLDALPAGWPGGLDAIIVADNPDKVRASAFSAAVTLSRQKHTSVILSMATRDRNRLALISDALGSAALGVEGILCMSGQHQSTGVCPQAAAANDIDSIQLIQALKKMVLYGSGMNGKAMEPELKLQIGATVQPYLRPMELNLMRMKKKISVGADFLVTQAVFDLDGFGEWMDAVRKLALDKRTAIIATVLPLAGLEQARELQRSRIYGPMGDEIISRMSSAQDPAGEGIAIASELALQLRQIPGVRGIHVLGGHCEYPPEEAVRRALAVTGFVPEAGTLRTMPSADPIGLRQPGCLTEVS